MLYIDNVYASGHVSTRLSDSLHAMTLHGLHGDARKASLAFLISVAFHAALLIGLAAVAVVGPVRESNAPFPLYLGPIGAAGGIGASGGFGAPQPAAGGESPVRSEPVVAPPPAPLPVPNAHEVTLPKPRPPAPVVTKSRTQSASKHARPLSPSSGEGASSNGMGAVGSPSGVPEGSGSGGAGAGGTASYEQLLAAWLDSHKYYPSSLRRRGIEGDGKLRIQITRAGRVLGIKVTHAFTHPSLESIAEDWVKRSEPFPPMPESIPGESYTFVVPVVFRLE